MRAASQASDHLDAVENLNALDDEGSDHSEGPAEHEHAAPEAPYDLDLRGVRFGYEGGEEVLHGIDLHLEPAEKLAVLGPSGSGKSTLLALLRGDLAPTGGSVTLGGVETRALGDDAHRYFGVIQQDTYLFDATLLENLTLGEEQITRDRAEAALRSVGLGALLDRLPKGLDTPVDEARVPDDEVGGQVALRHRDKRLVALPQRRRAETVDHDWPSLGIIITLTSQVPVTPGTAVL